MASDGFRALIARVRAGDEGAAAEVVRTYAPVLRRIIRVRLSDRRLRRTVGESDVFQSVMGSFFLRAALGQYELDQPDDLARLLAVIARNKVADQARKRDVARDGEPLDDARAAEVASPGPSPSGIAVARQLADRARAHLPSDVIALITLREEGLDWNAIAARVGGTPDALRKRHQRAIDEAARALGVDEAP